METYARRFKSQKFPLIYCRDDLALVYRMVPYGAARLQHLHLQAKRCSQRGEVGCRLGETMGPFGSSLSGY